MEFDVGFYRWHHADLRSLDDASLRRHYELHGRAEGRVASRVGSRAAFLDLIDSTTSILEIGPFHSPCVTGPNVAYFDVLDRNGLIERATSIGLPVEQIPEIDYVHPTGDLSIVDRRFDAVLSSHCVEHQPDLVRHFDQVSRVLAPGGRYFLLIPDKRFCFDHFIAESTIADVIGAHVERRVRHTPRSVLEHRVLTTHNDPPRHWAGDHESPRLDQLQAAIGEARRSLDHYVDVHAWLFTPSSFRTIVDSLIQVGMIELRIERVYETVHGAGEFFAILRRSVPDSDVDGDAQGA